MNKLRLLLTACLSTAGLFLCSCISKQETDTTYWLGADVSSAGGMAARGQQLKSFEGDQTYDLIPLMKELGLNAVRFRVWVNPRPFRRPGQPEGEISHAGLCDKEDVLAECLQAKAYGLEIMLDFHYSDTWADPKKQTIPAAWAGHPYEQMREDLADHTREVLQLLKDNGVEPKWVQIGNETRFGLLWNPAKSERDPDFDPHNIPVSESVGHSIHNPEQYAGFIDAGSRAAKEIFPDIITIVHLDNGFDRELYDWNLGILEKYGADYDMVGMSLYPYWAARESEGWEDPDLVIDSCIENIKHVYERFGKESMIVETGFTDSEDPEILDESYRQFVKSLTGTRDLTDGHCHGIFYWAPESRPGGYSLGAWGTDGRPSKIMRAYKDTVME